MYASSFRTPKEIGRIFQSVWDDTRPDKAELRGHFLTLICIPISSYDLLKLESQNISLDRKTITIYTLGNGSDIQSQKTYPIPHFLQHNILNGIAMGKVFSQLLAMKPKERNAALKTYLKEIWPHFDIKVDDFRKFFQSYTTVNSNFKPKFISKVMSGNIDKLGHPIHIDSGINLLDWWMTQFF